MHIIYLDYDYDVGLNSSYSDKIKLIKKYHFDGVILFWNKNLDEIVKELKLNNLFIENVHLPFDLSNQLWVDSNAGDEYADFIISCIQDVIRNRIKTVVFHITKTATPPEYNLLGLNRIKKILSYAEENKVFLALENLRRLDYLDFVYNNLKSDYLKFCFDSGHANAYSKNIENFPWEKYQDKIICVHLHDNDGEYDSHQIPFEGNINWKKLMDNLKKANYHGPLTCESVIRDSSKIKEEEFVKKVKHALDRLSGL